MPYTDMQNMPSASCTTCSQNGIMTESRLSAKKKNMQIMPYADMQNMASTCSQNRKMTENIRANPSQYTFEESATSWN